MRISADGPALHDWQADPAIDLWWAACQRRVSEHGKVATHITGTSTKEPTETTVDFSIEEWEAWTNSVNTSES